MAAVPSAEAAEGSHVAPLPCVPVSELSRRATDRAFHDIRRLANILSRVNLDSRREDLLDYIRLNRARLIKAYAVISWLSGNHGELVANAGNALAEARSQREQIDTCQDQFFFMHGGLFGARQRLYDVPTAVDVLIGGRYSGLPKGIQYCGGDIDPRPMYELPDDREEVVSRVDRAVRLALLRRGGVPEQFSSYTVRNGVLTLAVEGEFQLMVTLHAEKEDAEWTLLAVEIKVKAREGESIAAPTTDFRQQRYLHEVVQKAMTVTMDSHGDEDENVRGTNPLLAAYEVCHDLCCGMVLEILHAQAVKLASRVRGLWATQLVVIFHKETQVLDLCLWHREFSAGLGGTGRDVGVGGVRVGDAPAAAMAAIDRSSEGAQASSLPPPPPPPTGCRFLRVHRPVDRHGKILTSLGPVEETQEGNDGCSGHNGHNGHGEPQDMGAMGGKEEMAADKFLAGAVEINPDELSCGRMVLAAARTFASHKIQALVSDVHTIARQLRTCVPRVTIVGGLSACICPWGHDDGHGGGGGGGAVQVSVDVKSGRYLVKDTLLSRTKAMSSCVSRLQEALNLLPNTERQSLGDSIAATLSARSAGRSVLSGASISIRSKHDGEQQDLRQQQVCRCMSECFGLLRRGEVEHVLRRVFGTVPHDRWQALLGRSTSSAISTTGSVDAGTDFRSSHYGTARLTFVRLGQFREGGVRLSDEWRSRSCSYRMRRRRAGGIQLTKAEREATKGRVQSAEPAGAGLGFASTVPVPRNLGGTSNWDLGAGGLPSLAASLVGGYDGGVGVGVGGALSTRPLLPGTSHVNGHVQGASGLSILPAENMLEETGEVLSFFLEVSITGNLQVEHTLIAAALSTVEKARFSLRPVVGETYKLVPQLPQGTFPCGSLEAALLPLEPPPALGSKRSASCMDVDDGGLGAIGPMESMGSMGPKTSMHDALALELGLNDSNGSRPVKKAALGRLSAVPFPPALSHRSDSAADATAVAASSSVLYEAVQICHRLIPFARLQHALLKVGTGLTLDFHELTRCSGAIRQQGQAPRPQPKSQPQPNCAVFLAGESGWSSEEVSALSAKVTFSAGHTQADRWEWDVTLASRTLLVDYEYAKADTGKDEDKAAMAVREIVHEYLPLVKHIAIGALAGSIGGASVERSMSGDGYGGGNGYLGREKLVKFRFPPDFSVHVMCRSFALAGEGLTAMHTLAVQATKLLQVGGGDAAAAGGYRVVSSSPMHVAVRDSLSDHVVLLTHSAFSARHISSAQRPGLVLIPLPNVPTCPAAMRELEAAVRKHRDLGALLHGLSWTVPILAVVARAVPGVGSEGRILEGDRRTYPASPTFVLTVVSPACFVLSTRSPEKPPGKDAQAKAKAALTLMVEAGGKVRVSGVGRKEAIADAAALRDLLLEWIASSPE